MKDQSERARPATFVEKMRERLVRGTEAARSMIARVREILQEEERGTAPEERKAGEPTTHAAAASTPPRAPAAPTPATGEREVERIEIPPEFATATMGNILLAQGRVRQAMAVFERALERSPDDTDARRGLERCREVLGAEAPASAGATALTETEERTEAEPTRAEPVKPAEPEPQEMLDRSLPPWSYNVSEARALPVDPTTLVAYWEMTDEAFSHAATIAGEGARPSLRVLSEHPGPGGAEQLERFIEPVPRAGDYFVRNVPPGAMHHVTIGVRGREGFVPVAEAAPVATPRGTPAPEVARVRGTLALPSRDVAHVDRMPRILSVEGPREAVESLFRAHPAAALERAEHVEVAQAPKAPILEPGARPWSTEAMPSSADLARRGEGAATEGGARRGWTSSGQWTSSGGWPPSGGKSGTT